MAFKLLALGLLHIAVANPTSSLQGIQDMQMVDDTVAIGSYVRAVRAAAPHQQKQEQEDYKKTYESESDGVIGYSRKKSGGGKKGYQHFDSYHKKAGDHYELETEDSYGKDEEGQQGAHSHRHEKKEKPREQKPKDEEDVERLRDDIPEIEHEELKEGAPDGNGGVEAHGHDPNDYILPEKYTYGSGEEYDF
ncbi:uncharacterized protein LOC112052430 isoform X2 [Bicyclus anynana]|uniref:Uncharacterized protein LOC112052430 isoform X2 n=1 Tax=Bicyclus anynana TaxID=110368 RepID=A0ABM3LGN6_BICAN|nr:uncharacterized protein LOC112052430 isoform X2 [Bicyclus anynana]